MPGRLLWVLALCSHASGGWIDPDTPKDALSTQSLTSGTEYNLVMSDEFNRDGRTFRDGDDPVWTAIDRPDTDQNEAGMGALQYYNSSHAYTENGSLILRTTDDDNRWKGFDPVEKKYKTLERHFSSAMVQSWNKFCFTGGIFEVDIQLPGNSEIGGLWPAVWLLGNLGRATYEGSTNMVSILPSYLCLVK
jgi:beta-glucanase (GH16 family)